MQMPDEVQRHMAVHHVVQQLPNPHYRTLEYLLRHLSRIAAHGDNTGMTSKNLAIVWAPNLLRPLLALDKSGYALLEVNVQAVTIEYLIRNVHRLFQEGPIALVSSPLHPNSMFIPRQPRLRSSFKVGEWVLTSSLALSFSRSKSIFSQPFQEKCIREVVRVGSIIIFHLSKLWKAKFFILCDVILLMRL